MAAPKRTMTMIASVKRIRRRSSGIFTVFRNAEIIDKKLLHQKHGHPERSRRIPWHYRKAFATGFLDLARDDGRRETKHRTAPYFRVVFFCGFAFLEPAFLAAFGASGFSDASVAPLPGAFASGVAMVPPAFSIFSRAEALTFSA